MRSFIMPPLFKTNTQAQKALSDEQKLSFIKHQHIVSILLSPEKLRPLNNMLVQQGLESIRTINESVLQAILSDGGEKSSEFLTRIGEKHRQVVDKFLKTNRTFDTPVDGYEEILKEVSQKFSTLAKQLEEENRLLENTTTTPAPRG